MKGEFIISSFAINQNMTVQAKFNNAHAVVNGSSRTPIRLIIKAALKAYLKDKGFLFANPETIKRFNRLGNPLDSRATKTNCYNKKGENI